MKNSHVKTGKKYVSHLSKGWSTCQKVGPFVKRVVHLSKGAVHLSKVCQNAQLLYYLQANINVHKVFLHTIPISWHTNCVLFILFLKEVVRRAKDWCKDSPSNIERSELRQTKGRTTRQTQSGGLAKRICGRCKKETNL